MSKQTNSGEPLFEAKRLERAPNGEYLWIINDLVTGMTVSRKLTEEKAEFIVRACNRDHAFDDLLMACERALRHFETIRSEELDDTPLMACLRRAVAKGLGATK